MQIMLFEYKYKINKNKLFNKIKQKKEIMKQEQIDHNLKLLDEWRNKFSFPITRKQAIELLWDSKNFDKKTKKYTAPDKKELYSSVNFSEVTELYYCGEIE